MRLDQTRIAVRERGTLELFDLALAVTRRYALPLAAALAAGALPLALVNAWLLRNVGMTGFDEMYEVRYAWNMALLVFLELPLASAPVTLYLGQALFVERPRLRQLARDAARTAPQFWWHQLVPRGVLPAWLLTLTISWSRLSTGEVFLALLCCYVAVVRAARPYLGEIVLLERTRWRARKRSAMTTRRRSAALHAGSGGDAIARWIAAAAVALLAVPALWLSLWFVRLNLTNAFDFGPRMFTVYFPLSLWIVGGFLSVVRFLSYLDQRIRGEGWEVELRIRAQAATLARQLV
jgi:hypothetical protein